MRSKPRAVLYNPRSVFYTMPLGPLAVASCVDRTAFDVHIIDGRLETDPVAAVLASLDNAVVRTPARPMVPMTDLPRVDYTLLGESGLALCVRSSLVRRRCWTG